MSLKVDIIVVYAIDTAFGYLRQDVFQGLIDLLLVGLLDALDVLLDIHVLLAILDLLEEFELISPLLELRF